MDGIERVSCKLIELYLFFRNVLYVVKCDKGYYRDCVF